MVDAVTSTAAAGATDTGALGKARLAENFDTFLTLLTTQLKNQDPLSPMDSNQFTQQMVQMTGVEQQLLTNDLLKQLVSNTGAGVSTAVSLIGKDVRAATEDAALSGGKAQWAYRLDSPADSLKFEVLDSQGKVVHAEAAQADGRTAGDHAFTWNGRDLTGQQLKDGGSYTLKVTALDPGGKAIGSTTYVQGVVTGVEQADGSTYLTINGGRVSWDKVTSIRQSANNNDNTAPESSTAGS
jgi:flagellar basal-body rod modification protein FlgD